MKDYELSRSRLAPPFLFRICMLYAYTRPRYQVSIYRTIGPLVYNVNMSTIAGILTFMSRINDWL